MGSVTARRFMQVAEVFGDKSFTVKHLPPTALYELAAPKTPIEVRDALEREIERLIALLDAFDGDAEAEPSIGWAPGEVNLEIWADRPEDDLEDDVLDQPHDVSTSEDREPEVSRMSPTGCHIGGGGSGI